ncbi:MAG: uroporphyrinogen-III synthase [Euryarchaeota archaeon]|nr:uroporphyrinogen-III synthase [Euryarchaeota archaeon]MBU4220179.1 uroporphyrinogen-III synthase [Euryarchaeota archaeon]MBU4339568.1 uroporphyrinogen-III synthase [Euryarchaeota archaeon]
MKIAVTKLREKSEGIQELFRSYGHEALIISTMTSVDPSDPAPLARLAEMASTGSLDILIFTSALGVDKLFERSLPSKKVRIVSVGPKTAKKVEEYGFSSEVIEEFSSEHFANHLGKILGKTVGIARAEVPNPELIRSLEAGGATVVEAPAYRLEPAGCISDDVLQEADAVIFTSARSFEYSDFHHDSKKELILAAIGEKTAEAMRKHGFEPDIVGDGTLEKCLALLRGK